MMADDYTVDVNKPHAVSEFSKGFNIHFSQSFNNKYFEIVILCIGTDRSTGDCLGPLVGHKLRLIKYKNIHVYGTLDNPVHAKNLKETVENIYKRHIKPFIIGVDACLGKPERVGCISIGRGPVRPGAGVNKRLPEVGDMHVVGVVNIGGFMEYIILQNTRLNLVMKMADTISNGLHFNLWKHIISKGLHNQNKGL